MERWREMDGGIQMEGDGGMDTDEVRWREGYKQREMDAGIQMEGDGGRDIC